MYIFVVEMKWSSSSVGRFETRVVMADNVVKLDCTMNANCTNQSLRWIHYSTFNSKAETWYNGQRLDSMLALRGVRVDKDTANGRSVMTIPKARLTDSGQFQCLCLRHRPMNFQLIVTGNICIINFKN